MAILVRMMASTGLLLGLAAPAQAALVISSDATSNVTCSAGVCSATAAGAVLNVTDLTTMLAVGSLTVQSGSQAQDILIEAPFSWTSSNALTLDSFRAITVDKPVSDAGPAAFNIAYNDGGTGGELLFRYKGRVSFTSTKNKLAINGQKYTLLSDIASMASAISSNPSGFYALQNNYNAAGDGTYGATPIPTEFTGTFEGLGNTISNLSIDCEPHKSHMAVGLFTALSTGGVIKSLRLGNISYIDNARKTGGAGGLVGGINRGYLFDDHVSGAITAKVGVGGLTASNVGTIDNSSTDVKIVSNGSDGAGGLSAGNEGTVTASYASGELKAPATGELGGLVGLDEGIITDSYATGQVNGERSKWVGGFAGENNRGTISESYSIGKVSAKGISGGFGGAFDGEGVSNDYWDTQTSGTTNGTDQGNFSGITGLTTKQFKSELPSGFDPSVWAQSSKINNGYPYLIDNPPPN